MSPDQQPPATQHLIGAEQLARIQAALLIGDYSGGDIAVLYNHIEALTASLHHWKDRAESAECFTKVLPCTEIHEKPYDFKHCETHDRTFALDGSCDYAGKSVMDHLDDQIAVQRVRAMKAEDELTTWQERDQQAKNVLLKTPCVEIHKQGGLAHCQTHGVTFPADETCPHANPATKER